MLGRGPYFQWKNFFFLSVDGEQAWRGVEVRSTPKIKHVVRMFVAKFVRGRQGSRHTSGDYLWDSC
jgi:hypothetical protein